MSEQNIYRRFIEYVGGDFVFYSHDLEGVLTYITPNIEGILGIPADQVIGEKWYEVFNASDESIDFGIATTQRMAVGEDPLPFELEFFDPNQNKLIAEIHVHPVFNENNEVICVDGIAKNITKQKEAELERENLIGDLKNALEEIKTLKGILPICSYCHKIRDDEGAWDQLESYISRHTEAKFSHGICEDCEKNLLEKLKNKSQ